MGNRLALPQFIAQLVEVGARELRQVHGLAAHEADRTMMKIVGKFCDLNGKRLVYVPDGTFAKKAVRDARIFAEWSAPECPATPGRRCSADRIAWLADRHNITCQQVYMVLAKQRALQRKADPAADEQLKALAGGFDQVGEATASAN